MSQFLIEQLDSRTMLSGTTFPYTTITGITIQQPRITFPRIPVRELPVSEEPDYAVRSKGKVVLSRRELRDDVLVVSGTHLDDVITVSRGADTEIQIVPQSELSQGTVVLILGWKDGPNGPVARIKVAADNVERTKGVIQEMVVVKAGDHYSSHPEFVRKLKSIRISGGAGDDVIRVSKNLRIRTEIDGGNGNDTLQAGRANDVLRGGNGDDRLTSAGGALDYYTGGAGTDSLTGKIRLDPSRLPDDLGGFESFEQITVIQ